MIIEIAEGPWYRIRYIALHLLVKDGGFQTFRLPLNPERLLKMWDLKCIKVFRTLDAFLLKCTICKSKGQ